MRFARGLFVISLCGVATLARGDAAEVLRLGDAVDEIGVARIADEAGDATLRKHLEAQGDRDLALVAARAVPHAHAPERLVGPLVALAYGRDPQLAPEAARALVAIAQRLTPSELAAREVLTSELAEARAALTRVPEGPAPRADIVYAIATLSDALTALGAPLPAKD